MPISFVCRNLVFLLLLGLFLSCVKNEVTPERYEMLVWTNAWMEIRKREVALPLEVRYVGLQWNIPLTLIPWKTTIEDHVIAELLHLHRIVGGSQTDATILIEFLPVRFQFISTDRAIYEMRGSFHVWLGSNLFRSNVVIFHRVFAHTNYPEEKVYYHLITQWAQYLAENIHYGWSVSQDFSSIPLLGGTNEKALSSPWSQ